MGLRQGDPGRLQDRFLTSWMLPLVVCSLAVIVALFGDTGRAWLSFYRPAIAAGEFWRLLSGHFVHLGVPHLIMNVAGLILIWYLTASSFTSRQWLLVTAIVMVGLNLGLWFLEPNLIDYVGLSGLLHGLLAAGIVASLGSGRSEIWILGIGLAAKLAYEHLVGPLPGSENASGGTVIVAAHAHGALSGALAAGLLMIRVRTQASI